MIRISGLICRFLTILCAFLSINGEVLSADLQLEFTSKVPLQGELYVELYRLGAPIEGSYDWPSIQSISSHNFDLNTPENINSYTLTSLPLGSLCVRTFLDLNENKKLDRSAMGLPKEPVGFANNPVLMFGEPAPDEACFVIEPSTNFQQIELRQKKNRKKR